MNKYLLEFKNYYEEQLSNQEFIAKDENNERLREEFIKEYSIDKIRKLSLDEYILGKDKLSLSYQLEFGKYSKAVCSIAGYRSYMHGIWYKKEDNNYYTRSEGRIVILDNPQGYWVEFRKDLTEYLKYAKDNEIIISVKEMYPKLQYMPRALCKYLAAYYPDKFINISSKQVYKKLMDLFGFEYKIDDSNELLSYKLNKAIRNEIIEVNENSNYLLGLILYKFYEERYSEEPTKIQNSENDNQMYDEWWPKNYSPNISIEEWITLLTDTEIFYTSSLEIMKRIKDIGGEATCKQLSEKYGEAINFYNAGSSSLARRIAKKTNCQIMVKDNGDSKWWPILYVGKEASFDEKGTWIWKLRKELYEALDRVDLSNIALFSKHDKNTESSIKDKNDKYSKEDFLNEVYMDENKYKTIVSVMKNKKNIILQGAPGVGKTYCAKRLAYSLMGMKDDSKIEFIQFHQSYSYEDFVMGYRPIENGFELGYGPFIVFVKKQKMIQIMITILLLMRLTDAI